MRRKIPDLVEALTGHFDDHHALLVGAMLHRLDHVEAALVKLDAVIAAAMTPWAHQIELLQTIPGVGLKTAQVIIAETGADMAQFPTAAHLAAWAGVAPAMHESAGKRRPAGSRKGNKWLASMLVEAASSVSRTEGHLPRRPVRPDRLPPRQETGAGRGGALDAGLRLLHARP